MNPCKECGTHMHREIKELKRKLARLKKDKERLDEIDRWASSILSIRQAIDSAIRQQKKEGKG